ncbi:MAG: peptidyl-prolyl cis-trans isomerase D [Paraglaciecola sp.]|jgi:peptidyl-prolyl cis-trans isomerase D
MALIGKIRNNSWLLVILIGLGLGGFILMDMMSGQQSVFGSSQTMMADIEGQKVDIQEFNKAYDLAYRGVSGPQVYSSRAALYNYFVEETVLKNEAEAIGLGVSDAEIKALFFSPDPSKVSTLIQSRYRSPQTGQFDPTQLNQIKGILEGGQMQELMDQGQLVQDFPSRWKHQEREVEKDRLQSKLVALVSKGMYTPNWLAEMMGIDQNTRMDFDYVQIPFDAVDDNAVTVSDADYATYLSNNKAKYYQDEETRVIDFVTFNVEASDADKAATQKQIAELNPKFKSTDNDSVFVQNNYGSISQFWVKKDGLVAALKDTLTSLPKGSVYGPYIDGTNYKAVKILDKQVMQDSADSRHILIQANTPAQFVEADRRIDSLKNVIERGANDFATLAAAFSTDPGSKDKGGEYEYIAVNNFVAEYNDIMFYKGQIGKLYKVRTSYGVHLVEPQGRKGESNTYVRVAYVSAPIVPSDSTQSAIREQAQDFVAEHDNREAFLAAAAEKGLTVETSPAVKRNDFAVGSLGTQTSSRNIIRWAFNNDPNMPTADVGDVAPDVYAYQDQVNYYNNKYVAVVLNNVRPAGEARAADFKGDTQVEIAVMNMKKAEKINADIKGASDLNTISGKFSGTSVEKAQGVNLGNGVIQGKGAEPEVVATAFATAVNTVSVPVTGKTGVFVVKPTSKGTPAAGNIATVKTQNQNSIRSQVRTRLMQALRKTADVDDNRSKFF